MYMSGIRLELHCRYMFVYIIKLQSDTTGTISVRGIVALIRGLYSLLMIKQLFLVTLETLSGTGLKLFDEEEKTENKIELSVEIYLHLGMYLFRSTG